MPFKYLLLLFSIMAGVVAKAQDIVGDINAIRCKHHVPELAFAFIKADKIITQQYLGYHKLGDDSQADTANAKDYFHLGSNTKAISGFIAAYLVEHHKIKWSTKLFDLFPELKKTSNNAYAQITLQDLLSHRAKIQPYTSGKEFKTLPKFIGNMQSKRQQFASYLLKQKPVISKEIYNYSNAGYAIAATMLEKAAHKSWEQLVDDILGQKLGLKPKFGWPNKTDADQPWGHWEETGKLEPIPGNVSYDLHLIEPAGDISMTLPDYATFIQLNLQGLLGKANLLKPATYQFLHYGLKEYAIGWANDLNNGNKISEHDGSAGTFYCRTHIDGKKGMAYIIIVNMANKDAQDTVDQTAALLDKLH